MGLLEETIKEIRRDIKHFRSGKLKAEDVHTMMSMYHATLKASGQILQAWSMAVKYGKKYEQRVLSAGLLGSGTTIDLTQEEIEVEKIFCPLKKEHISRAACLDFSGDKINHEDCKGCDAGLENKKLLLDRPMYTA
jgi:hypothetical protein